MEQALRGVRAVLVLAFVAGLAISIADVVTVRGLAAYGTDRNLVLTPLPGPRSPFRVSGAARGDGVADGDTVELVHPDTATKLGVQLPATPLRVHDVQQQRDVTLKSSGDQYGAIITPARRFPRVVRVLVIALALVLVLLRGMPSALALSAFLFTTEFFLAPVSDGGLGIRWREIYILAQPLGLAIQGLSLIALVYLFSPTTTATWRYFVGGVVCATIYGLYEFAGMVILLKSGFRVPWLATAVGGAEGPALLLTIGIGGTILGVAVSDDVRSRRLMTIGIAVLLGFASGLLDFLTGGGGFGVYSEPQTVVAGLLTLIMTGLLLYAVLRDHLFDINLVINRAVVVSMISATVVGSFILIEALVPTWAAQQDPRIAGTAEMLLALAIGVSLRPLHRWVDLVVDKVFFGKRHRATRRLTNFARDVHEVGSRTALLLALEKVLPPFGRVETFGIYLTDDYSTLRLAGGNASVPAALDCDDVVTLTLRTSRSPVIRGEFPPLTFADAVFPMLVRGQLRGMIACERKKPSEPYSPEELAALSLVARESGLALVALEAATAKRTAEENARLRRDLRCCERGLGPQRQPVQIV